MGIFDWLRINNNPKKDKGIESYIQWKESHKIKTTIDQSKERSNLKAIENNNLDDLINITRMQVTDEAKSFTSQGTNLTPDVFCKVIEEISITMAKGANPKYCKAKNYIPDNFEWDLFDKCIEKGWYLWEKTSNYYSFLEEFPAMDTIALLNMLDRQTLLKLVEIFNIKNKNKKEISKVLSSIISQDDQITRDYIFCIIKDRLHTEMIKEKKYLYPITLMSIANEINKKKEWKGLGIVKVEFSPAPDACPICIELDGVYPINKVPLPGKDTHPGCRCSLIIPSENYETTKFKELREKYDTGEFPMKRCPHCSEWTEGNSVKCRKCNKEI